MSSSKCIYSIEIVYFPHVHTVMSLIYCTSMVYTTHVLQYKSGWLYNQGAHTIHVLYTMCFHQYQFPYETALVIV